MIGIPHMQPYLGGLWPKQACAVRNIYLDRFNGDEMLHHKSEGVGCLS